VLVVENVVKAYDPTVSEAKALDGVSLTIPQGVFACIVGRSGSGKSTLLNVLSTLLKPDAGRILYNGRDLGRMSEHELDTLRSSDFSMIFQLHHLLPYLTALENVLVPFMKGLKPISAERRKTAVACLERVGLAGKHDRLPGKLSGGEQQRVAIARALVVSPRVLFADEPTGSLDKKTGDAVMALLKELNAEGITMVMVSHQAEYAALASQVIELEDGRVKRPAWR